MEAAEFKQADIDLTNYYSHRIICERNPISTAELTYYREQGVFTFKRLGKRILYHEPTVRKVLKAMGKKI